MVTYPSEVHVTDIAKWLEGRKDSGRSTVLFLGARAGGLFRGKTLYSTVQYFSPRTFSNMSRIEQFKECCRVLHEEDFSKSDINAILLASLPGFEVSEADIHLSELVKSGFFDAIISTNIDDLFTRAFEKVGMKEAQDFQMFIPQKDFVEDHLFQRPMKPPCLVIKAFGDLEKLGGEYSLIRNDFYFDRHEKLKNYLASILQNDVLMLGYDPFWDRAMHTVFLAEGQELWYVNEGPLEAAMVPVLQGRRGKCIVGGEGNYERFIQMLHWHLMREKSVNGYGFEKPPINIPVFPPSTQTPVEPPNPIIPLPQSSTTQDTPPVLSTYEKEQRRRVFIVYSQKDRKPFEQLQIHLARYERSKQIDVWNDTKIVAGTKWREEIKKTLDITRVAILLISSDFLASSFIEEDILPPLLQAAETGGAIILPVILNHCVFEDTSLQQFQSFNKLAEPLMSKKLNDRHKIWVDLVRYVITLVKDA